MNTERRLKQIRVSMTTQLADKLAREAQEAQERAEQYARIGCVSAAHEASAKAERFKSERALLRALKSG